MEEKRPLEENNERKMSETEINAAWARLQARVTQEREDEKAAASILAWVEAGARQEKARRRSMGLRTAAVAAILALVMVVVPPAFGAESIVDIIVSWTESAFSISSQGTTPTVTDPSHTVLYQDNNAGLTQLRNKLREYGVNETVVPTWIPENFVLNYIDVHTTSTGMCVSSSFRYDDCELILWYQTDVADMLINGEWDTPQFTSHVLEGITHYIFSNNKENKCFWINGDILCRLGGNISQNEIYTIIDSIYSGQEVAQ